MITLEAVDTHRTAAGGDAKDMRLKQGEVKVKYGKGRSDCLTERPSLVTIRVVLRFILWMTSALPKETLVRITIPLFSLFVYTLAKLEF